MDNIKIIRKPIINAFFRLTTIIIKAVFILLLPEYVDESDVLDYANVQSIQQFLVVFLGLDLYKLSFKSEAKSYIYYPVLGQFKAHLKIYAISSPIILSSLTYIFTWKISLVALLLILSEHLVQESHRVLIYFDKHLVSSGFLLIKSVGILIILFSNPSLILLLSLLVLFNVIYLLILLIHHDKTKDKRRELSLNISFSIVSYTFIGALLYRLMFTLDRPIITYLGHENVLIFAYYSMISTVLIVLYDAIILSYVLPKLYKENRVRLRIDMLKKAFIFIVIFSFALVSVTPLVKIIIDYYNFELPIGFDVFLFQQFVVLYTVISLGLLFSSYLNRIGQDRIQLYINLLGFISWLILLLSTRSIIDKMPLLIIIHLVLLLIKVIYVAKTEVFAVVSE